MNLNHKTDYQTGDQLTATAWNNLAADVNELGAGGVGGSSEYVTLSAKNNVEITSPKNINIEPASDSTNDTYGDISFKPGDDIEFLSEHRPDDKQDEISLKIHDANKKPIKLLVNVGEITLTTKDKVGNDSNVLDVNINSAKNTKGYLKVRAQAIDLRCEDHGGIAIQPKGTDGQGNINKIKFEHGGGDGLEFGTFNTEHTSLFTNDYRFNKNGVIKLATRTTTESDKADANDPTTALKYVKQQDDFYDVISQDDPTCTWNNVVDVCSKLKNRVDFPTACYIVPVSNTNSVITGDNDPVTTTVSGTYCTINGYSQSISDNYDSNYVTNAPNLLSPAQIQSFEETPERLGTGQPAAVITKYVRSSELDEVFNVGTGGALDNTVATFLEEYYQNGHAVFKDTNNNLYCLVGSNDKCDLEFGFNVGNKSYTLYMKDIYNLIQHMKSNGLWS